MCDVRLGGEDNGSGVRYSVGVERAYQAVGGVILVLEFSVVVAVACGVVLEHAGGQGGVFQLVERVEAIAGRIVLIGLIAGDAVVNTVAG